MVIKLSFYQCFSHLEDLRNLACLSLDSVCSYCQSVVKVFCGILATLVHKKPVLPHNIGLISLSSSFHCPLLEHHIYFRTAIRRLSLDSHQLACRVQRYLQFHSTPNFARTQFLGAREPVSSNRKFCRFTPYPQPRSQNYRNRRRRGRGFRSQSPEQDSPPPNIDSSLFNYQCSRKWAKLVLNTYYSLRHFIMYHPLSFRSPFHYVRLSPPVATEAESRQQSSPSRHAKDFPLASVAENGFSLPLSGMKSNKPDSSTLDLPNTSAGLSNPSNPTSDSSEAERPARVVNVIRKKKIRLPPKLRRRIPENDSDDSSQSSDSSRHSNASGVRRIALISPRSGRRSSGYETDPNVLVRRHQWLSRPFAPRIFNGEEYQEQQREDLLAQNENPAPMEPVIVQPERNDEESIHSDEEGSVDSSEEETDDCSDQQMADEQEEDDQMQDDQVEDEEASLEGSDFADVEDPELVNLGNEESTDSEDNQIDYQNQDQYLAPAQQHFQPQQEQQVFGQVEQPGERMYCPAEYFDSDHYRIQVYEHELEQQRLYYQQLEKKQLRHHRLHQQQFYERQLEEYRLHQLHLKRQHQYFTIKRNQEYFAPIQNFLPGHQHRNQIVNNLNYPSEQEINNEPLDLVIRPRNNDAPAPQQPVQKRMTFFEILQTKEFADFLEKEMIDINKVIAARNAQQRERS